jgi:hypothetical protein
MNSRNPSPDGFSFVHHHAGLIDSFIHQSPSLVYRVEYYPMGVIDGNFTSFKKFTSTVGNKARITFTYNHIIHQPTPNR